MAVIRAPQAWSLRTGSRAVKLCIVDSGVEASHPDLAPNILASDSVFPDSSPVTDGAGHGTHVAGERSAPTGLGLWWRWQHPPCPSNWQKH